ncbi:MAG TPA: PAS domain S-box protein [Chitinophagaceae bacterium]|nr:PAS domain S-box protein [Chitinophagaceae bacterium]
MIRNKEGQHTTTGNSLRTQAYLDIAEVILIVIRPDQTVELINRKGCEVLGYRKEDIEGKNWFDNFIPEDEREHLREIFSAMVKTDPESAKFYENGVLTSTNDIRLIQWHNAFLRSETGEVLAILSSGEDVTLKKVLQHRLAAVEAEKRKMLLSAVLEAQENERREIAYELHDNVNQILTTCKILLENEVTANDSVYVKNTYKYLQVAIDEIRNLSHRLNPAQLEDIGLENSIKELLLRMNAAGKFAAQFNVNDSAALKKLDYKTSLSLFRIIQEQLSNVVKHANASQVRITMEISKDFLDLEISDNGKGFDTKTTIKGLGLKNIRNRAEFHRGTTYIAAAPGEGCLLSVCIPLAEQNT